MISIAPADRSNGYETIAEEFITIRNRSNIGVTAVLDWARFLPPGGAILDLGCGHGIPISKTLIDEGFAVYGIDASARMIDAFRDHFPQTPTECSAIEDSTFFDRRFDGALAWGLMFLLAPEAQATLIQKVASALKPGGRFLFTSPHRACEWLDSLTGRKSVSLGSATYRTIVESEGLALVGEAEDEGQNNYYFACKPDHAAS